MSIFDKLAFWKKPEDDFGKGLPPLPEGPDFASPMGGDFGKGFGNQDFGKDFGSPSGLSLERAEPSPFGPSLSRGHQQSFSQQGSQDIIVSKNLEILSSKLDALQASLDSMNQRLMNIERIAMAEQQDSYKKRW